MTTGQGRPPVVLTVCMLDGTASGLRVASIQWSRLSALVVPRDQRLALESRREADYTSVYFLIGADETSHSGSQAYVGCTDCLQRRFVEHQSRTDWTVAVFFFGDGNTLTSGQSAFLERRLYELMVEADAATVLNGRTPNGAVLEESDELSTVSVIDQIGIVLGSLGYDLLTPRPRAVSSPAEVAPLAGAPAPAADMRSPEFRCSGDGFDARMRVIEQADEDRQAEPRRLYRVAEGGQVRPRMVNSLQDGYRNLRFQLVNEGVIVEDGDSLRFANDHDFTSVSAASAVVSGSTIGKRSWMTDGGVTLPEWLEAQAAGDADPEAGAGVEAQVQVDAPEGPGLAAERELELGADAAEDPG